MHLSFAREVGIGIAAACTVWIATRVVGSARRLNAGVRAFKAEQEKQDGVVDPYAALTGLYPPEQNKPPTTTERRTNKPPTRFGRRD